jgi:hypothetical protein
MCCIAISEEKPRSIVQNIKQLYCMRPGGKKYLFYNISVKIIMLHSIMWYIDISSVT